MSRVNGSSIVSCLVFKDQGPGCEAEYQKGCVLRFGIRVRVQGLILGVMYHESFFRVYALPVSV